MSESKKPKQRIINCHTHIFLGEHVPPHIAKTFIPWPLYRIFTIPFILSICRYWYIHPSSPHTWKYKKWYKQAQKIQYAWRAFIRRHAITDFLVALFNWVISYHAIVYFFQWLNNFFIKPNESTRNGIQKAIDWLQANNLLLMPAVWIRVIIVLFVLFFIERGRKLIFFMLKKMWSFLSILPDKKTLQFIARYINIGRFAYYKDQGRIFIKLKNQYEAGTGFILLPMDMEFMDAGKLRNSGRYEMQMLQLAKIKKSKSNGANVFPFVFVDPRRDKAGGKDFFSWTHVNGKVKPGNCFIKEYIEDRNFSGFKIYPALGYYPFDERLLPLWKYAADNQLPILTHTIKGTIFYRGRKDKSWGWHPVLKQADGEPELGKLFLPELKNEEFINNFTHPLNYLCLVEEKLLRVLVSTASAEVKSLFGFNGIDQPMDHNLENLKLCFGHFGGEDEWKEYFEKDRDDFTSQLKTHPERGIGFVKPGEDLDDSYRRLEQVWKWVDWYSIICSMMLQYKNLYADISYIVHDPEIVPLLKQTLQNKCLRSRVLFGTDFYVVRNHKSEKEMLADIMSVLSEEEFDAIARENPVNYLRNDLS